MAFSVSKFTDSLTLTLLDPKVIISCYQYSPRPACISVQSDQAISCSLSNIDNGQFQKWKLDKPIKKFNRLRVTDKLSGHYLILSVS